MAEMKQMIQEVKDSVTASLQAFTDGTTSVGQLQESLKEAGVAVSLKAEELEGLRTTPESACVCHWHKLHVRIIDTIHCQRRCDEVTKQMGLTQNAFLHLFNDEG
jgi:hypothetical protein